MCFSNAPYLPEQITLTACPAATGERRSDSSANYAGTLLPVYGGRLEIGMAQQTQEAETGELRLPSGVVLKPPVSLTDLMADTEQDPEGAEEFVNLIRAARREGSRPDTI